MIIGLLLGIVLAIMRLSPNPLTSSCAWLFVWAFRGTGVRPVVPLGHRCAVFRAGLGIPSPEFFTFETKALIPLIVAAILGLGLTTAAAMSEIVRAGILSVDEGRKKQPPPSA